MSYVPFDAPPVVCKPQNPMEWPAEEREWAIAAGFIAPVNIREHREQEPST